MKSALFVVGLLCISVVTIPLLAQERSAPDDPKVSGDGKDKQLAARQRLEELEEKMNRLATILARTEPDHAVLLRRAYQQCKEDLILEKMDGILRFLEEEKLDEAISDQKDVGTALERLLALLLDKEDDLEELLKKIKRLEEYRKEIQRLIKEETAEKKESDRATATEEKLQALRKAKETLDSLIKRQGDQVAGTKELGLAEPKPEAAFEKLRGSQEDIREETEDLAFSIDEILGKGVDGEGEGSETGKALGKSAESMAGAEGNLSEMDQPGALGKEKEALSQLEEARAALEKEEKELRKLLALPDYEKMTDAQEGTRKSTDDLARKMGEEGGEEGSPGQENVGKAGGSMGKASEKLGKSNSQGASGDQQEALDQLQQAKEEVEDALEQARRELQEEVLALLEERLLQMLAQQKEISKGTIEVDKALGGKAPDRAQTQTLTGLSKGEDDLAGQSDEALELLREEGSTVVFPQVLEDVKGDLLNVVGLIASTQTGEFTQAVQKEIEVTLEELIEAVRKKQEHAGSCSGGDG